MKIPKYYEQINFRYYTLLDTQIILDIRYYKRLDCTLSYFLGNVSTVQDHKQFFKNFYCTKFMVNTYSW